MTVSILISDDTTTDPTAKAGSEEEVDAPKKKKKKSKAAVLEERVVPVPTLLELDNEISAYKGCSDSSCFKDCRGGCFGKNFLTDDGDISGDRMKLVLQLFRGKTRNKTREELESYCVDLFRKHCTNLHSVVNSNLTEFEDLYGESAFNMRVGGQEQQSDRFIHDWSVELDSSAFLPSGGKQLQLCRHSFSFLYGLKPNTMKRISKVMKDLQTSEMKSARQEKPYENHTSAKSTASMIYKPFLTQMDWILVYLRHVVALFAHRFLMLMLIYGWRTIFISSKINRTLKKYILIPHGKFRSITNT